MLWPDEHAIDVRGLLLLLKLHDIYFLTRLPIRGEREGTHPAMGGRITLDLLVAQYSKGATYSINDASL